MTSWCGSRPAGVCHTDLSYRGEDITEQLPILLGHEAAGVVEATGDGVRDVRVNTAVTDPITALRELTAGFGANVVIDTVGRPETWRQALYARDLACTVVLVGVPAPDMRIDMPLGDLFSRGGALKSSWYGDCLTERDFPTMVDLYQQGRLPLDRFISERIGLKDIESDFTAMHSGRVLRSAVVL